MIHDDEDILFGGLGGGCLAHGDEFLRECALCGAEFCTKCFPGSAVCADCADESETDEDEDDADALDAEVGGDDDNDVDELLDEADALPEEDLLEENDDGDHDRG